jgi:superfamily II DNA or RNA helicase
MIDHYRQNPNLRIVGCTATPDRADEKALGEIFQSVAFTYDMRDACEDGWLVWPKQKYLDVEIDFDGMHYRLGDFDKGELKELLARGSTLEKIASDTVQWTGDRRTLVFSDCVDNAERLTIEFNRHADGCARIVTGETPKDERRAIIADYRAGRFQYLVNVGVASRGFDVPEIACIVQARPTCSRALYAQQIGRGSRPIANCIEGVEHAADRQAAIKASSKSDVLILDLIGNSLKHKLITAVDILGGKYGEIVRDRAEKLMLESDEPLDIADALEEAERLQNADIAAEAQRRGKASLKRKSSGTDVDPFDAYGLRRRTEYGWEANKAVTSDQSEKLERWKIRGREKMDYADAEQFIADVRRRARDGLCTLNQERMLKRYGYATETMTYEAAHGIMDKLAANGWRMAKVKT